jgi:hypothetical protein
MADQSDRPEPDLDQDAREGEVSDRGYPEAQPEGGDAGSDFPDEGPERGGPALGHGETPAPSVSGGRDSPPSKATGNPRAAGG